TAPSQDRLSITATPFVSGVAIMRAALMTFLLSVTSLFVHVHDVRAQVGQCSNPIGQVFSFGPAPNFPGALVIQPANFSGQFLIVGPVAHPVVAYANVDWAGNGTLLMHNGALAAVWYGRTTLIAQCVLAQPLPRPMPPPPPPPTMVRTPPTY